MIAVAVMMLLVKVSKSCYAIRCNIPGLFGAVVRLAEQQPRVEALLQGLWLCRNTCFLLVPSGVAGMIWLAGAASLCFRLKKGAHNSMAISHNVHRFHSISHILAMCISSVSFSHIPNICLSFVYHSASDQPAKLLECVGLVC